MISNSDLLVGKNGKINVIYIEKLFSSLPYKLNNEYSNKEKEEYVRVLEISSFISSAYKSHKILLVMSVLSSFPHKSNNVCSEEEEEEEEGQE